MSGKLKWRFDASTFKLLGRGLITDRITAIYELVKNCYDANATTVEVMFSHVEKHNFKSTITIRDNGFGMSLNDIRDKWLVVGTANKRTTRLSPAPFNRRHIGEKGVGRFATDKLGEYLKIKTKRQSDKNILSVTINWGEYERANADGQQSLFTDFENEYSFIDNDLTFKDGHGTELIITMLHEAWDEEMLMRLDNQLGRILPPLFKINPPFDIYLDAPEFGINTRFIKAKPIEEMATIHVHIPYDALNQKQGTLFFNKKTDSFEVKFIDKQNFGLISLDLYYFNAEAKKEFRAKYDNAQNYIEGAKIYRDGVICTPFAEYESGLNSRRDVLGIDKRRYRAAFDKFSTREFVGIINITKDENPDIIDATNRQDFVDNSAYRNLKEFIIRQIDELSEYRYTIREEEKERRNENLKSASADVKDISKTLDKIVRERPDLKSVLGPTIEKAKQATDKVSEGFKESQESKKDFLRKEALYLSLMSMQEFASDLAHGIRFTVTPIKHAAEYIIDNYPASIKQELLVEYLNIIYTQSEKISTLVDFMLSAAQVDIQDSDFSIEALLSGILDGAFAVTLDREGIKHKLSIKDNIELTGKRKFLEDVLSNLVSNSVKALRNNSDKKILCESYADDDNLNIIFSDNGVGVDSKIASSMFEMFKTTTAEEGGSGLGLFIARTRMKALNGSIELVPSVFNPKGASFKLSLPLKK